MGKLSEKTFGSYRDFIYEQTGISINMNKKELLEMKVNKAAVDHGASDLEDMLKKLVHERNPDAFQVFVNHLTTNTTHFFRENHHFEYISSNMRQIIQNIPRIRQTGEIRVWVAGSSSGQEAVTLSMVLNESLPDGIRIRILATDINSKVLKKAMSGEYSVSDCDSLPESYRRKYFRKVANGYKVSDTILKNITYRYFNLRNEYNSNNKFDIIFCRNVMIYFDNDFQQDLVDKFERNLIHNGYLFVGHSESLMNKKHGFAYLGPSIYQKK